MHESLVHVPELSVTGCRAQAIKLTYSECKCANGSSIGTCGTDVREHDGSMFKHLLIYMSSVADVQPQPLKRCLKCKRRMHTQIQSTGTAEVGYMDKIFKLVLL